MPNIYTPYTNGTFEALAGSTSIQNAPQTFLTPELVTVFAGAKSAKLEAQTNSGFLNWILRQNFSNGTGVNPIVTTLGKYYKVTCRIYVPSANKIASDSTPLFLAIIPALNGTIGAEGYAVKEINIKTVLEATDNWVELSSIFQEVEESIGSGVTARPQIRLCAGTNSYSLYLYNGFITKAGTMNEDGVILVDNITVEETEIQCSLELGTPSYTYTNETEEDANNGTITVYATANHLIQYSLNGGTPQSSNIFSGLAPGTYSVQVIENNPFVTPCVETINDIIILPFNAPEPPPTPSNDSILEIGAKLNDNNYFIWRNAVGSMGFSSVECNDSLVEGLPNQYIKINNRLGFPVVCNGELFSFFINFKEPYTNPIFSRLRLAVANIYGVVQNNVATLNKDELSSTEYNIWSNVTLSGLLPGFYFLIIYDNETGNTLFTSSEFEVLPIAKANKVSVRIQYRATIDIYKFRYSTFELSNYLNTIRLRASVIDEQSDGELTQYRGASTGRLRNVSFELDKFIVLEIFHTSLQIHRAVNVIQAHDIIFINDVQYLVKSLYKIETNKQLNTPTGKWELYEQDFSTANRYGKINIINIIGSEDPLLLGDNGDFIKL